MLVYVAFLRRAVVAVQRVRQRNGGRIRMYYDIRIYRDTNTQVLVYL